MSFIRISAEHTAKALLINLAEYCETKGKDVSRFRISRDSLKRASNRKTLREAFVVEVIDEMAQLGWSSIDTGTMESDNELAFIQTSKIEVWPRLGVARVLKLVRMKGDLESVHESIDDAYEQYHPEQEDDLLALED
jgi:hypothetical protein